MRWQEPNWKGRDYVVNRLGPKNSSIALIVLDKKEPHGWYRRWFAAQQFNQGQFVVVPVMDQDFVVASPGANQTYTSKASWNNRNNIVEVIGGGAAGATGATTGTGGGGGGGGAYNATTNFQFTTPGTSTTTIRIGQKGIHTAVFGTIGTGAMGGHSWIGSTAFPSTGMAVAAVGGRSATTATTATGAAGGAASNCFPTTSPPARNGGAGGTGTAANVGGGGGGAAGPFGIGGDGSGNTGGTGDGGRVAAGAAGNPGSSFAGTEWDATHGSGGGAGGSNANAGTGGNGGLYGGGAGAGSRSNGTGGDGGQGIVVLTWTVKQPWGQTPEPIQLKGILAR